MLNSFGIAITVGTVLGFLAGLGVGGGSLLLLWLTAVLSIPYPDARIYNLLFFLPSAAIASFFRFRKDFPALKGLFPAMIAGCIGAVLFSLIGQTIDTYWLKKLFGGLLILTGIREILYKNKKRTDAS